MGGIKKTTQLPTTQHGLIQEVARRVKSLRGEVYEIGVYCGASLRILAEALPEKKVTGFDTFTGIPDRLIKEDGHAAGDFGGVHAGHIRKNLSGLKNAEIIVGEFPDSAHRHLDRKLCLVHCDGDIYYTAAACCRLLWPLLVIGGVMVFDDYGFGKCRGEKLAVDEFFGGREDVRLIAGGARMTAWKECNHGS